MSTAIRFRFIIMVVTIVLIGVIGGLVWLTQQVEAAYVYKEDLKPFTFITTSEQLERVTVPRYRDFTAITDPSAIVGLYVGPKPVAAGSLVHPADLVITPPLGQRQFSEGFLPPNTVAYPIDLPSEVQGVYQISDAIDIFVVERPEEGLETANGINPADQAILLFQKVKTLGVVNGKFLVALTHQQVAAYEGWKSRKNITFIAAITQAINPDLPPLESYPLHLDYDGNPIAREIWAVPTPTPEPIQPDN